MGGMYWYLAQLNTEKRKLLQHIETFLIDRMSGLVNSRNVRSSADCLSTQDYLHCLYVETEISLLLSEALSDLYALLSHCGLLKSARRPFAEAQLVHEARMKPYVAVTDPSLPDLKSMESAQIVEGSLAEAVAKIEARVPPIKAQLAKLKTFSPQAGKYVGTETRWKAQIKQLETTCVAIFVGASLLKRTVEKESDNIQGKLEVTIPPPGKRYHDWWVVPQIKPKKV
jgi:hypothetical protein